VLKPHSQILQLDPRLTILLIDTGLAANNLGYYLGDRKNTLMVNFIVVKFRPYLVHRF